MLSPIELMRRIPDDFVRDTSREPEHGPAHYPTMRELAIAALAANTRVVGDDTAGISTDGVGTDTTVYEIDLSAVEVLVGGVYATFAALNDQAIIGAGAWAKSYQLDGSAAAVLSADGKTYEVAVVALLVNGALELHAVVGDEADDGMETAPDADDIWAALDAADIADWDPTIALVVTRVKIQRVAVDTITMTHGDPAATASLKQERLVGSVVRSADIEVAPA